MYLNGRHRLWEKERMRRKEREKETAEKQVYTQFFKTLNTRQGFLNCLL